MKHQYRVTDESGPSHEKTYTVVLELGDERYTAQHKTIKGAQHLAAANALQKTNYKQPVSRSARGILSKHSREKYGKFSSGLFYELTLNGKFKIVFSLCNRKLKEPQTQSHQPYN